jgi:hypothetical protein
MATMRYDDIDPAFPVAGQDNESQGFRDNFDAIQESLEYTSLILTSLQDTSVTLGEANVFTQNASINGVKLIAPSEEVFKSDAAILPNSEVAVDYTNGSYHALILGGSGIKFVLSGWPELLGDDVEDGRYARIRMHLTSNLVGQNRVPTFDITGSGTLNYDGAWPTDLEINSNVSPVILEFWTYDGGDNVYAKYLGKFGETDAKLLLNNLSVTGNTSLGINPNTHRVILNSIPVLPSLTTIERNNLSNTSVPASEKPQNGMLVYNTTTKEIQAYANNGWGILGSTTISSLANISDVELTNLANNQILQYNTVAGKWRNGTAAGVLSVTGGAGISATTVNGAVTLANTGVTSIVAGSGVTVSSASGVVTISSTSIPTGAAGSSSTSITTGDIQNAVNTLIQGGQHNGVEFTYNNAFGTDFSLDVSVSETLTDRILITPTLDSPSLDGPITLTNELGQQYTGINGQVLKTTGTGVVWAWPEVALFNLNNIEDVNINVPRQGDQLKYNVATGTWTNTEDLIIYNVKIGEYGGSTGRKVFYLNNTPIEDSTSAQLGLQFKIGKRYRFNLDDPTNAEAPLRFSRTPDTVVPETVNPYNVNVFDNWSGQTVPGRPGSYIEILITDETPSPLYLYGREDSALSPDKLGAEYPILVNEVVRVANGGYTAIDNQTIMVDSTTVSTVIRLPADPVIGTTITVVDNGNAAVNNITINRNGKLINGIAANKIIASNLGVMTLVADELGWVTIDSTRTGVVITDTTNASALNVGSFITAGGASIAKDLRIGGTLYTDLVAVTSATFVNLNPAPLSGEPATILSIGSKVLLTDETSSVNGTSGALIVAGGAAIGENLNVGGNLQVGGTLTILAGDISVASASFVEINPRISTVADGQPLEIGGPVRLTSTASPDTAGNTTEGALTIDGGAAVSGAFTVGGRTMVNNRFIYNSSEDLLNGSQANLDKTVTQFSTTSQETGFLSADGASEGQIKIFIMRDLLKGQSVDPNAPAKTMTITVTRPGWKLSSATGTMTFADEGVACTMQFIGNRWYCIGNNGVTFA